MVLMALTVMALLIAAIIDMKTRKVPDLLTISGMVVGIIFCGWDAALSGIIVGGGLMFAISLFGLKAFGKPSFGGGDIKLMAMVGALCGWKIALLTFGIAPLLGFFEGLCAQRAIAFAPYISLACYISIIWKAAA